MKDAASTMPADASRLYAKNVANLLALMTADGTVVPDFTDEVIAGACLAHAGEVRHGPTAEALGAAVESGSLASADAVGSPATTSSTPSPTHQEGQR